MRDDEFLDHGKGCLWLRERWHPTCEDGFPTPAGRSVAGFGSVAPGAKTSASEIDFLWAFGPRSSLFHMLHLQGELRTLLSSDVEVESEGALKRRDAHIRRGAVWASSSGGFRVLG